MGGMGLEWLKWGRCPRAETIKPTKDDHSICTTRTITAPHAKKIFLRKGEEIVQSEPNMADPFGIFKLHHLFKLIYPSPP
jgi:hypothetical protein